MGKLPTIMLCGGIIARLGKRPRGFPTVRPTSSIVIGNELRFVTSIDKHVGAGPPSPIACVALNLSRTDRSRQPCQVFHKPSAAPSSAIPKVIQSVHFIPVR